MGVAAYVGNLTSIELSVLTTRWGRRYVPFPFAAVYTGDVAVIEKQMREAEQKFDENPPLVLFDWGRTMLLPDIRVEASVVDLSRRDEAGALRILGVRRGQSGFVGVQKPAAPNETATSDIEIRRCHAHDLAQAVVEAVPAPPRIPDSARLRGSDQSRFAGSGFIQVREGRFDEWRIEENGHLLRWSDDGAKGRLLARDGDLLAATNADLVREINLLVRQVVRRIREARA